jgi:uncharacterized DUF497 family protein
MNDDDFEWDDDKAAHNLAAHGVSFEAAREVFKDPFAIEYEDNREHYGEDGMLSSAWWTIASYA